MFFCEYDLQVRKELVFLQRASLRVKRIFPERKIWHKELFFLRLPSFHLEPMFVNFYRLV